MLPDFAVNSVIKIAHNEGFTDFKITTKSGSNQGDNFQSVMYAINLYGTRRINGKMQLDELDLLCKATPGNDTRRKNFSSSVVFDREIYIYSKVLPAFTKFQKDKGLSDEDSYKSYPVVYACEEDEETGLTMLMMEDLRPKNYKMWPKEKTMRLDHELMILRELGKCHGVAMAMKDQRPSVFQEFKKLPDVYIRVLANGALKSFIKSVLKQAVGVLENPKHKRMMENFVNTYLDRVNKLKSDQNCDEFGVIVHGDCWNNNFLFQYDANKPNVSIFEILLYFLSHSTEEPIIRSDSILIQTYLNKCKNTLLQEMKLTNFCLVDWQYTHYRYVDSNLQTFKSRTPQYMFHSALQSTSNRCVVQYFLVHG